MTHIQVTPPCQDHKLVNAVVPYDGKIRYEGELYEIHIEDMICIKCHNCGEYLTSNSADEQITAALAEKVGVWHGKRIQWERISAGITPEFLASHAGISSTKLERLETHRERLPTRAEFERISKTIEKAKSALKGVPYLEMPEAEKPEKVKFFKNMRPIEEIRKIADAIPVEAHEDDARIGRLMRFVMERSGTSYWEMEDCGGFTRNGDGDPGFAVYNKSLGDDGGKAGGLFPSVLDALVEFSELRMKNRVKNPSYFPIRILNTETNKEELVLVPEKLPQAFKVLETNARV